MMGNTAYHNSIMASTAPLLCLVLVLALSLQFTSSTSFNLSMGSSLSVENPALTLMSPNTVFSAGFFSVGENAFCFGIWFSEPSTSTANKLTIVWIANRNMPVNGKRSKLSLHKNGNLVLTDVGRYTVWSSDTVSNSSAQLHLQNNGNLVLITGNSLVLWQSFDSPTDTLLPHQALTMSRKLVSCRSHTNYSSGFYSFYFDNDNVLRLFYDGPEFSSIYWPNRRLDIWQALRSPYNNSRIAMFDSWGNFYASDNFTVWTTDYGAKLQRIFKMDVDGNLRGYSRKAQGDQWNISWVAVSQPCQIHGICGAHSYCSKVPSSDGKCSCLPGYKVVNKNDWFLGCEPDFTRSCDDGVNGYLHLTRIEMYGFDYKKHLNTSLQDCKTICSSLCNCTGFQHKFDQGTGTFSCYPKFLLGNGHWSPEFDGDLYIKLPKSVLSSYNIRGGESNITTADAFNTCSDKIREQLERIYEKRDTNGPVDFMLKFAAGLGGVEIVCIFLVWFSLNKTARKEREVSDFQGYLHAATGFRRFSYSELKTATKGFTEEIGRGGGGIVYKGKLSDRRVAAIKQLNAANQGEAEFFAEVSLIGKLYHMNLIEMWGYCMEKNHRLLVYEYVEHGSLAKNLSSDVLDSEKRFDIAVGMAKGLAYLHEECLEWVLHCDVKPENILLDSEYNPKVADFGLSKLLNRGELRNSNFSRIRGTRGYMAPEWVQNMPITSKVDVYSYGIVVLEMLTGMKITEIVHSISGGGETQKKLMLVTWAKENMNVGAEDSENGNLQILVEVALQCLEEDKDARPTMRQVVEMLLHKSTIDS